jgi:hypothetical protein
MMVKQFTNIKKKNTTYDVENCGLAGQEKGDLLIQVTA